MSTLLPRRASRRFLPWWLVLLGIVPGCVELTPPWQQGSGKDGASDVAIVPATETGVAASGGAVGDVGWIGSGGAGGFAQDGQGGVGGAQADLASPSLADGFDSGVTDAPVAVEVAAMGNADSASVVTPDDVPMDLPVGSGGAGGSDNDAAGGNEATGGQGGGGETGGVTGTGGATVNGGTTAKGGTAGGGGTKGRGGTSGSGGTTAKGGTTGSGGTTAKGGTSGGGTGGTGTGGVNAVDATVSACSGYHGVDAGVDAGLVQGLVAYYPCDQAASSTNLLDLSGNSPAANATLGSSGTGGSGAYGFVPGQINNALSLTQASKGYAALPAGILAGACEMTIATWVYLNSESSWQRIWDFGNDSTVYMFLASTTNTTSKARFAITLGGTAHEEGINGDAPLSTGAWIHVAVVLGPAGGVLYVDGIQKGTNASMKLRPADLGSTQNNYIGRSQFSIDPYLDGSIDDFRVYNRALSEDEIKALHDYTGS